MYFSQFDATSSVYKILFDTTGVCRVCATLFLATRQPPGTTRSAPGGTCSSRRARCATPRWTRTATRWWSRRALALAFTIQVRRYSVTQRLDHPCFSAVQLEPTHRNSTHSPQFDAIQKYLYYRSSRAPRSHNRYRSQTCLLVTPLRSTLLAVQ